MVGLHERWRRCDLILSGRERRHRRRWIALWSGRRAGTASSAGPTQAICCPPTGPAAPSALVSSPTSISVCLSLPSPPILVDHRIYKHSLRPHQHHNPLSTHHKHPPQLECRPRARRSRRPPSNRRCPASAMNCRRSRTRKSPPSPARRCTSASTSSSGSSSSASPYVHPMHPDRDITRLIAEQKMFGVPGDFNLGKCICIYAAFCMLIGYRARLPRLCRRSPQDRLGWRLVSLPRGSVPWL